MGKPHRLAHFDYRGRVRLFVTCIAHRRHFAFQQDDVCDLLVSELRARAAQFSVEVTAYCLMPDHVHLLLAGTTDASDLPALLRHWKQATGYAYSRIHHRRLWQGNYWDWVLRDSSEVFLIARYLITDPIRSSVVHSLEEYRWWGSDVWSRDQLQKGLQDIIQPHWWREP